MCRVRFSSIVVPVVLCLSANPLLAWNLGHLHFARSDEAEVYMGIHVFLTGLRGLIAPAVGMLLWTLVGAWVWIIAIALAVLSGRMYLAMAREELAVETRNSVGRSG